MMMVLEQATRVLCLAEDACDKTTKGDWQSCTYQKYRWRMDQEVGHLYALFGGGGQSEGPEAGQGVASQGARQHRRGKEVHELAAPGGVHARHSAAVSPRRTAHGEPTL